MSCFIATQPSFPKVRGHCKISYTDIILMQLECQPQRRQQQPPDTHRASEVHPCT